MDLKPDLIIENRVWLTLKKVKITKNYTFFKNIKNEKKKFLNISLGGS